MGWIEFVASVIIMANHFVFGHPRRLLGNGTEQPQSQHRVRPPSGHAASQIGAVRVPKQQHGCGAQLIDEVAQKCHHIVVAVQSVGSRLAHARQIQIDPPVSGRRSDGLDGGLEFAMVDTGTVERDERHSDPMLDIVDRHGPDPALHTDTVMTGTLREPRPPRS